MLTLSRSEEETELADGLVIIVFLSPGLTDLLSPGLEETFICLSLLFAASLASATFCRACST